MEKETVFDSNVAEYDAWYDEYPAVYQSELAAIREQLQKLPENIMGIEVGLGTGRFALPLGIKEGVEPSVPMAQKARKRGIEVIQGTAEKLPYGDLQFDFVLFVTVCHLSSLKHALTEAKRVLKNDGALLIGFLDKDRTIADQYMEKRHRSNFFRHATFYTVDLLTRYLKDAGFKELQFNQTLFGNLESIKDLQMPKPGHGEGSFVVVKAIKK
jgi:SAM-dependent methyltransferase